MADITIADLLYLAKERYSRNVADITNREPRLLNRVKKATDVEWDGEGRFFVHPIHLEGGQSQGFYAEAEQLPPSEPQVGERMIIFCKAMAFTVRITRQNLLAIKQGPGAFFNSKAHEVEENTISLLEKMSRAFGGAGMGVLGILAGAGSVAAGNTTFTFTDKTNMQHFRKGLKVDIWAPAYPVANRKNHTGGDDNTTFDVGWKIIDVNRAARTITVQGDHPAAGGDDAAAGDYVLPQNEGIGLSGAAAGSNLESGKEIMGLEGLFSTGQFFPKLQNLALGTFTELQAPRDTAGAPRAISPNLLQKMHDDIQTASGKMIDFIWLDYHQNRTLLAAGLQDVRHVSEKVKLGYTEMTWNGKPLFVDRQAHPGKVFLGSMECLGRVVLAEMGPMDGPMGERIPRFAVTEWAFGADMNLFNRQPNGGGWIEDLTTS